MVKLFSITAKDLIKQTFCVSGGGGQRRDRKETGVRFIHEPSGATGQATESRKQHDNTVEAFKRLASSPKMQAWLRAEAARRSGGFVKETPEEILQRVDEQLALDLKEGRILFE